MKKISIISILAAAAIAVAVWYFFFRKGAPLARQTVQTTSTQKPLLPWFPGWTGFNQQSIQATTNTVTAAFDSLKSLANNFGLNDGGNSQVQISGSGNGGQQSSGSGAGLPVDDSWDNSYEFA